MYFMIKNKFSHCTILNIPTQHAYYLILTNAPYSSSYRWASNIFILSNAVHKTDMLPLASLLAPGVRGAPAIIWVLRPSVLMRALPHETSSDPSFLNLSTSMSEILAGTTFIAPDWMNVTLFRRMKTILMTISADIFRIFGVCL